MRTDIISKDAQGNVLLPDPQQYSYIMSKPYILHRTPTTHPGFYHRHIIRGATAWDFHLAMEGFFIPMRDHFPNFVYLDARETRNPRTGPNSHVSEIFYAMNGALPSESKGNRMLGEMKYPYL